MGLAKLPLAVQNPAGRNKNSGKLSIEQFPEFIMESHRQKIIEFPQSGNLKEYMGLKNEMLYRN